MKIFETCLREIGFVLCGHGQNLLDDPRNQREITPKINTTVVLVYDIVLLCFMTHRLIVLYNCLKFHSNGFNCFQLTARTRNSIAHDQRKITPKYTKQSHGSHV